jgi:hypothetical protein
MAGRLDERDAHHGTDQDGGMVMPRKRLDYKCNGEDHWTIDRNGRRLWCLGRECIVHGTGIEEW